MFQANCIMCIKRQSQPQLIVRSAVITSVMSVSCCAEGPNLKLIGSLGQQGQISSKSESMLTLLVVLVAIGAIGAASGCTLLGVYRPSKEADIGFSGLHWQVKVFQLCDVNIFCWGRCSCTQTTHPARALSYTLHAHAHARTFLFSIEMESRGVGVQWELRKLQRVGSLRQRGPFIKTSPPTRLLANPIFRSVPRNRSGSRRGHCQGECGV